MCALNSKSFNSDELRHYSRQIAMPQFGEEGQKKLKSAKIAVIGAGGLGAPVLQYLAAAGVGTIGIFDFDVVERSNLHRQVLFTVSDVGKPKSKVAVNRLRKLNPHIKLNPHQAKLTSENVLQLLGPYDMVVDGSDNFLTRYIVNNACLILDIPLVYGSIYRFEGQVTVFNFVDEYGKRGPDLYDLYPEMPGDGFIPDCSTAGVLGVLPGVIGSLQATEVIKIAAGIGEVLSGKLLLMDLLHMETQIITYSAPDKMRSINKDVVQKRLQNLSGIKKNEISDISVKELHAILSIEEDIELIDVRFPEEHRVFNIGGRLIPIDQIEDHLDMISEKKKTVIYCQTGKRSSRAIQTLQKHMNDKNLYNLAGGIDAWLELELD